MKELHHEQDARKEGWIVEKPYLGNLVMEITHDLLRPIRYRLPTRKVWHETLPTNLPGSTRSYRALEPTKAKLPVKINAAAVAAALGKAL